MGLEPTHRINDERISNPWQYHYAYFSEYKPRKLRMQSRGVLGIVVPRAGVEPARSFRNTRV